MRATSGGRQPRRGRARRNHPWGNAMPDYAYASRGRSPLTWAFLVVGAVFAGVAWTEGAPWFAWAPLALFLGLTILVLVRDERHGMTLTTKALIVEGPAGRRTTPLADIAFVRIEEWSESTNVALHFATGEVWPVPSAAHPSGRILARELRLRGVDVVDA